MKKRDHKRGEPGRHRRPHRSYDPIIGPTNFRGDFPAVGVPDIADKINQEGRYTPGRARRRRLGAAAAALLTLGGGLIGLAIAKQPAPRDTKTPEHVAAPPLQTIKPSAASRPELAGIIACNLVSEEQIAQDLGTAPTAATGDQDDTAHSSTCTYKLPGKKQLIVTDNCSTGAAAEWADVFQAKAHGREAVGVPGGLLYTETVEGVSTAAVGVTVGGCVLSVTLDAQKGAQITPAEVSGLVTAAATAEYVDRFSGNVFNLPTTIVSPPNPEPNAGIGNGNNDVIHTQPGLAG